jgi:flagellar biosynthesis chaperone FliJ
MSITIAIFIGLSFGIVFLFFYMFARDKNIDRKFQRIGMALEEMNEEIYKLQKEQKKISQNLQLDVEKIISNQMDEILENLIKTIKESQYKSQEEIKSLYEKVAKIENNIKMNSLPNFETLNDKKDNKTKIKELFEIGYSVEEIAKEVNMPAGEVQLYLKF